ncbi:hypothetical protein Pfo_017281 [Paulownia fortunei]|nr:hypothetical protein Pfo_017281 [Paulownia fortunei]
MGLGEARRNGPESWYLVYKYKNWESSKTLHEGKTSFLNCLALSQRNDEKCGRQKSLLSACMDVRAGNKRKPWGSINYHLQRLNRGRKQCLDYCVTFLIVMVQRQA